MGELNIDVSGINFDMPKKWKIELWIKKAKECLIQLKELETKLESMEAPRSFEAEQIKFKPYWKLSKEIDKLYSWMKKMELSNYPLTSQNDLQEFIEYWECRIEQLNEGDQNA